MKNRLNSQAMLKKNKLLLYLFALMPAVATAQVSAVHFSVFDSPAEQGEKFEKSFRQNDLITGVNINGREIMLQGEWSVLNTWFVQGEIQGSGRGYSTGILVLGRIKNKMLYDFMRLDLSLQPSKKSESKSKLPTSCLEASNVLHADIVRVDEKYMSCSRVRSFTLTEPIKNPDRTEQSVIDYAKANNIELPALGEQYYTTLQAETKNAAGVYLFRRILKRETMLDDQIAFTRALRASIRASFLQD